MVCPPELLDAYNAARFSEWAARQEYKFVGPDHIVAPDGSLWKIEDGKVVMWAGRWQDEDRKSYTYAPLSQFGGYRRKGFTAPESEPSIRPGEFLDVSRKANDAGAVAAAYEARNRGLVPNDTGKWLTATPDAWMRCAGCLHGHPAFILGNGPTLPAELRRLAPFFTVGVNRILSAFDPTVLVWTDANLEADIRGKIYDARCIACAVHPFDTKRASRIQVYGSREEPCYRPMKSPECFPSTGSMGATAALWAMALGCSPVFLLGMSGTYENGKADFYGDNPYHTASSMRRVRHAHDRILRIDGIHRCDDQAMLDELTRILMPLAREREWYGRRFLERHTGVCAG